MKAPFYQNYKAGIIAGLLAALTLLAGYLINASVLLGLQFNSSVVAVIHIIAVGVILLCWYYASMFVALINVLPTNSLLFKSLILHSIALMIIGPVLWVTSFSLQAGVIIGFLSYLIPLLVMGWYVIVTTKIHRLQTMCSKLFGAGAVLFICLIIMNGALFSLFI